MESIKVTIDKDGHSEIEAIGYTGADCEHDTAKLEKALGFASRKTLKPERAQVGSGLAQKAKMGQ